MRELIYELRALASTVLLWLAIAAMPPQLRRSAAIRRGVTTMMEELTND